MTEETGLPNIPASVQIEVNNFALFMFAWHLAYEQRSDVIRLPDDEDVESLARHAIRHFLMTPNGTRDDFVPTINLTAKAIHARFHCHEPEVGLYALNEVLSLIKEE